MWSSISKSEHECSGPRKGPPPPAAHQRHIAHRYYKLRCPNMAETALSAFNQEKNVEYEVVNPSKIFMRTFFSKLGLCCHTNFEARPKNDPSAPVEFFFVEYKRIKLLWIPPVVAAWDLLCKGLSCVCGKMCHPTDAKYLCSPHPSMLETGMSLEPWSRLVH